MLLSPLDQGTLTAIGENGLSVKISDHVNGFIPRVHMADVIIHKPKSKFTVGELLELRVIVPHLTKHGIIVPQLGCILHTLYSPLVQLRTQGDPSDFTDGARQSICQVIFWYFFF